MTLQDQMITTSEFSTLTGIPARKVAQWLRQGRLNGVKQAGKWMINRDQLDKASSSERTAGETSIASTAGYSISEFSAMTYLTAHGVSLWLKQGLLAASKDDAGEWRIDAANLESERIKRLLRS